MTSSPIMSEPLRTSRPLLQNHARRRVSRKGNRPASKNPVPQSANCNLLIKVAAGASAATEHQENFSSYVVTAAEILARNLPALSSQSDLTLRIQPAIAL